jgi:CBS domain-containing protein
MRVQDVMTEHVLSVAPETPIKDVAKLLTGNRISGLPVCDADGRVVGVVSEADIVRCELGAPEAKRPGFLARLTSREDGELHTACRTAGDAMTSPALTIAPGAAVSQAAKLIVERQVNRLPVVLADRLVGIVTRADLVRAFDRPDEEIEREVADDVLLRTMWTDPDEVQIDVANGEVELSGEVETHSQADLIVRYVSRIPGVVDVRSNLEWRLDDLSRSFGAERIPPRV